MSSWSIGEERGEGRRRRAREPNRERKPHLALPVGGGELGKVSNGGNGSKHALNLYTELLRLLPVGEGKANNLLSSFSF